MERAPTRRRRTGSARAIRLGLLALALLAALLWLRLGEAPGKRGDATAYQFDQPPDVAGEELEAAAEGIPVLCYHYFRPAFTAGYTARVLGAVILNLPTLGSREFWTVPIGEFERHLRLFRENGIQVVTLDQIAAAAAAGTELPRPAVVLTIDDADESVYTVAYPTLRRYGARAHLFVPTAMVGRKWGDLRVCTWDQLREMSDSGAILIESHTHDLHWKVETARGPEPVFLHPERLVAHIGELRVAGRERRLPRGTFHAVAADLDISRGTIAARTGRPPRYLAWPYGFASTALDSVAAQVGFAGTVSLKPNPWSESVSSWHIGRYAVTAKTTPDVLFGLLPGSALAATEGARRE